MKTFILTAFITFSSLVSHAEIIKSSPQSIAPSSIVKAISLIPGTNSKKLQIVVTDYGMSTDLSPRNTIYLGFAAFDEMGNLTADFKITDQVFQFIDATRKSAGHYVITTREYREEGPVNVIYEIDATQIFADELKERKYCGSDFCDGTLDTSISVKKISKPAR